MEESGANKHKEEGANPSHGMECEIIDPEESIISSSNHGGTCPPFRLRATIQLMGL